MSYLLGRTRDRIADLRRKRQDVEETLSELGAMERQIEDHLRCHDCEAQDREAQDREAQDREAGGAARGSPD